MPPYGGRMEVKMIKKIIASVLTAATLLTSITAFADGVRDSDIIELFVATDGDDRNNGTLDKPFATIKGAADKAAAEKAKNPGSQIIITVKGGDYFLNEGIRLDPNLSGTERKQADRS